MIQKKSSLRVALVHDQLSEFGGAERVLLVLSEMFPKAPIYTAFMRNESEAAERFADADIRTSWAQKIPGFTTKLHSPLRFLAPLIWESFDFTGYDLVISSASWFITKGILTRPESVHISYIHTPPRYLWGLPTSIEWQKHWPLRVYARVVNHCLREYDFLAAQRPDVLVANSENTRQRIQKFYRREAEVIYPPVELARSTKHVARSNTDDHEPRASRHERNYFLVVSRVVGGKGLALAVQACTELGVPLKVVGTPAGWSSEWKEIRRIAGPTIEFLGFVSDEELVRLYSGAQAFLATAQDEDFGMTVVEAQLTGTPVIAYRGGGYLETVVEERTGVFFDKYSVGSLKAEISDFRIHSSDFRKTEIQKHARKFSKERFVTKMRTVIKKAMEPHSFT